MRDKRGHSQAGLRANSPNKVLPFAVVPLLLWAALWTAGAIGRRARDPLPGLPRVVVWAWESPQNLDFINPATVGVAFLAETVFLEGDAARSRPRMQPLRVPEGTALIAVVRLERTNANTPLPPAADVARQVATVATLKDVRALQVDFDARTSERAFYRTLLVDLRARLPKSMPLSITALESWCDGDPWIAGLPVDDAVPMLFRMGVESYRPGAEFPAKLCQSSVGVSTDEPVMRLPHGRRWFIFHPGPWTRTAINDSLKEARRWE